MLEGDLRLERKGDALIVPSKHNARWFFHCLVRSPRRFVPRSDRSFSAWVGGHVYRQRLVLPLTLGAKATGPTIAR